MKQYRSQTQKWLWGTILLLALAVILAGCQPSGAEAGVEPEGDNELTGAPTATAQADEAPEPQEGSFTVDFTPDGHPFQGNPQAPVIVEEFSSFQCPFCQRYFEETYPELVDRYVETGQILYVFKDFPLNGQPQSPKAAEAARCAGEIGGAQAFWDMHDRLFANQQQWSGRSNAPEIFAGYAADLDLDPSSFEDCLDSGRTAEQVQADSQEGLSRGVRGTPSFFINGELLVGAQPISAFASAIENALADGSGGAAAADGEQPPADTSPSEAELLVPTPAAFAFERSGGDNTLLSLGDPQAPVTVVEFTDYQCPFCLRHFQETWPTFKSQYIDAGRVFYVMKDFPLTSIHPQAFKAHEAARCAAQAGGEAAYWEMHDRLFAGQEEWAENPEHERVFKDYASELGLDQSAFDACLDSGQQAAAVQASLDEGLNLGVTGTPTFFIAGYPFSGARPLDFFDQAITLAENGQLRQAIAEAVARYQEEQQQQQQPQPTMAPADVPVGDAPTKGDPDAPVTVVEYSDYQCPFCVRHFQETLPQLIENYVTTGQVRYVFKDFPLTSIHPQAPKAAEAARCARELGGEEAYWTMHDRLFQRQEEWGGNPEHATLFKDYAGEMGLDQAAFGECLDSGRYAKAVQADLEEGVGFGVTGTPAFFINGQPLRGAQPYTVFEQAIEAALDQ